MSVFADAIVNGSLRNFPTNKVHYKLHGSKIENCQDGGC